jgi:HPt (histidine-containing phosphotransfer) domain-containing protein/predicted metal-dependent hydrolase
VTIAKLIVEVAANVSALQRDLRRSQKFIDDFARHVERGMSSSSLFAGLGKRGFSGIRELTSGIIGEFDKSIATIRERLSTGLIDPQRAARELQSANVRMMESITGWLGSSPEGRRMAAEMTNIFQRAGHESGLVFQRRFSPQMRAAAIVRDLDRTFQRDIGRAREGLARGLINPQEFRLLSGLAANEFNQGLVAGIDRLAKSGRMTEPLRREMVAFTKTAGPRIFEQEAARELRERVRAQADLQRIGRLHNAALIEDARRASRAQIDAQTAGRRHALAIGEDLRRTQQRGRLEMSAYAEDVRRTALAHTEARRAALVHAEALREYARRTEESRRNAMAFGQGLSNLGTQLTRSITLPLLVGGAGLVKFAAEAEIARARLDVVFGPAGARQMVATLAQLRKEIPASTREIHNFAASFGEMLIPLGIAPKRAQEMSVALIEVAKNISLVQKVPAERAFSALRSALVSQTRELRKLGVNVTEGDIKREAFQKGWLKAGEQLTSTGRALAAFNVTMDRARLLSKATATASETFALRILFLKAEAEDAAARLGRELLPVLIPIIEEMRKAASAVAALGSEKIKLVLRILAVVAAIGPLIRILGALTTAVLNLARAIAFLRGASIAAALARFLGPAGLVAAAIYLIAKRAYEAKEALWDFNRELEFSASLGDSGEKALQKMLKGYEAQIAVFQKVIDDAKVLRKIELPGGRFIMGPAPAEDTAHATRVLGILRQQVKVIQDRIKELEKERKLQKFWDDKIKAFAGQETSAESITADPFRQQKEDVAAAIRRMQIVEEAAGRLSVAMATPLAEGRQELEKINNLVAKYGGLLKAPSDLLELQLRLVKAIKEFGPTPLESQFPIHARFLRLAAEQARAAGEALEAAKRTGIGVPGAEAANVAAQERIGILQKAIAEDMERQGFSAAQQLVIWQAIDKILTEMGIKTAENVEQIGRMSLLLRAIAVAARGVLNLAEAFGAVSDSLRNVLQGITGIVEGLDTARTAQQKIKAAEKAGKPAAAVDVAALMGGVIGIVGGIVSTIAGLFDKSETERARERLLEENNQRLSDLSRALRGMIGGLGDITRLYNQLLEVLPAIEGKDFAPFVENQMIAAGISMEELAAAAAELGIQIRDDRGRILSPAVAQLARALRDAALIAARFGQDLDGERKRAELRADVFDVEDTPAATIQREIQLLAMLAPELVKRFVDLDATTEEGRAKIEEALRNLVEQLALGLIPPEMFGDLRNLDELISIIMGVEGALDALREEANSLTDALKNVPSGYKVALARFEAMAAEAQRMTPQAGVRRPVEMGGGVSIPTTPPVGAPIQINGDVHIHDAGMKTGEEILDEMTAAARQRSRRSSGTTAYPFRNIA